jgi:hypothetical protein
LIDFLSDYAEPPFIREPHLREVSKWWRVNICVVFGVRDKETLLGHRKHRIIRGLTIRAIIEKSFRIFMVLLVVILLFVALFIRSCVIHFKIDTCI